ncbi:1-acyl-sn-glycerol-3-phosphate acyltransferase [Culturomica massiliensis]|uniref:1-acyl-sn-glycerol-3-phosphate acyltransferase n=1 Tax=Culturomica massiliensis TaxID=1841857 RepID=UPI00083946BE|nr:1-acyl-sn-glycerol-3-phosphate acyltransferase [Culturomica massiliensis]
MNQTAETGNETLSPIYLKEVFKSKNPALARWIPGFVYSWLNRIICIDDINDFIRKHGDRKGIDFADAIVEYLNLTFQTEGITNLPSPQGRYIFVSNHPLGGPDGIALISFLGKYYPDLKFPVNDILLNLKNLNNIFLPVNKHGGMSREAVKAITSAYTSDNQIIMFPAGLCSRKIKGKIEDLEWQKNFIVEAVKHHRDIVPIYISGQNSNFFYNLSNFRKRIGLKANIEMLWLPKEAFKKKNETLTLKIGKPISWQSFDKSKKPKEWAKEVREILYRL